MKASRLDPAFQTFRVQLIQAAHFNMSGYAMWLRQKGDTLREVAANVYHENVGLLLAKGQQDVPWLNQHQHEETGE